MLLVSWNVAGRKTRLAEQAERLLSVGPDPDDRWVVPGPDHIDDMFVELVMAIEQNPKAALAMAGRVGLPPSTSWPL